MRVVAAALFALALAAPARAQDPPAPAPAAPAATADHAIRPGMSGADVRARWGEPVATRRANDWTYLYYRNGNERGVGYYDIVFLQRDQVVDCIARGEGHVYLGNSSSPGNRNPEFTAPAPPRTTP